MAIIPRQAKRPTGLWVKMTAVTILGLCFIFVWTVFSSSSSSVSFQRESFEDISEPVSSSSSNVQKQTPKSEKRVEVEKDHKFHKSDEKKVDGSSSNSSSMRPHKKEVAREKKRVHKKDDDKENVNQGSLEKEEEGEKELEDKEEGLDHESEVDLDSDVVGGDDSAESVDEDSEISEELKKTKKGKVKGPLFESNVNYRWKMCNTRSKHNYIPCIDIEVGGGKVQYRHTERSCPRMPFTCMVPLPLEGYDSPVPWPESKMKILYKNVAHPKLAAYIKKHRWLVDSGEYLTFPQNQSEFLGGIQHYLESIEEVRFLLE